MTESAPKKRRLDETGENGWAKELKGGDLGFTIEEENALLLRAVPGGSKAALLPDRPTRFVAAAIYIDLYTTGTLPLPSLVDWLDKYAPIPPVVRTKTTKLKWRIYTAGFNEGAKEKEILPDRAIEFLELVDPTISITAGKHDYWETTFNTLASRAYSGLSQTEAEIEVRPEDWKAYRGGGVWHDVVNEEDGWAAYDRFLAGGSDEEVLALWNHEAEKEVYKQTCLERRSKIILPAAIKLLMATAKLSSMNDVPDITPFEKVFPGCPFKWHNPRSIADALHTYYGLTSPNRLPETRGTRLGDYISPLEHYARHFQYKEDLSDYEHYNYG
jgi:hypothetical protein